MSRASLLVNKILEADDGFDAREYLLSFPARSPRIRISCYSLTPGPEDGDEGEEEHGWFNEEGVSMEPDEFDQEEGHTCADLAIKYLNSEGAIHPSSSHFHDGIWYSDGGNTNVYTGEVTTKHYHLVDFDGEEQKKIFYEVAMRI